MRNSEKQFDTVVSTERNVHQTHSPPFETFQRDVQIHDIGGLEDFA